MRSKWLPVCIMALPLIICSVNTSAQAHAERQWPSYRGYLSSGVLDNAGLPESFDLASMKNIRWKTRIPGLGISSPVIWNEKLFVTTAISQSDVEGFRPDLPSGIESVNDQ